MLPCFLILSNNDKSSDTTNKGIKTKLMMQADLNNILFRTDLEQKELDALKTEAFKTLSLCAGNPDQTWFTCQMLINFIKNDKAEITVEESTKFLEFITSITPKSMDFAWHTIYSYSLLLKKIVPFCPSGVLVLSALERIFISARSITENCTPFLIESNILSSCRKILLSAQKVETEMLIICLQILKCVPKFSERISSESVEDCALLGEKYPMYRIMLRKSVMLSVAITLNDTPDRRFYASVKSLHFLQCSTIEIFIEDDKDVANLLSDSLDLWCKFKSCNEITTSTLFDPFTLFVKFSRLIFFDSGVLRDLIIESKGVFLGFLVKFFKVCSEFPDRITKELSSEDGSLDLFVQMLSDLKECDFDFNSAPLIRRIDNLLKALSK